MDNRKYIRHKITELETLFDNAGEDCAVLEELEEELTHRKTQRAHKLRTKVHDRLHADSPSTVRPPPTQPTPAQPLPPVTDPEADFSDQDFIDWESIFAGEAARKPDLEKKLTSGKPQLNKPADILDTWTALEALSPQSYKNPRDLIIGNGSIANLKSGHEPWLNGEKSRPKCNLYYVVYLGAIDLEKSTSQLLNIYQDKQIERPQVRGYASIGALLLDKKGVPVPDTGLAISSFGWSYAQALKGNLHQLRHWEAAEKTLKEKLEKLIYRQNKEGEVLPFSLNKAEQVFQWLVHNCEIPIQECLPPTFAIRLFQPFSKGEPEAPLLNSFFLEDLQRAKTLVSKGASGTALSQYLGISKQEKRYDVLENKSHIEEALQPKNTPLSRWPSHGRHSLVLLQQMAVNLATQELKGSGLFSVNGPPGTGKTTLLRDVVASVLVDRAKALYAFKDAEDAFEHVGSMKLGGSFVHLYNLDKTLRGFEVLVASTNNKAVENVSKELPLRSQVAEDIEDLNYFKTISDALSDDDSETWGLIAAVLGNSKNRSKFINKTWWDDNSSLQKYFKYITGQLNFELDDDGQEIIPKIIEECNPPKNLEDAKSRWLHARHEFAKALASSEKQTSEAQRAYDSYCLAKELSVEIAHNNASKHELMEQIEASKINADQLSASIRHSERQVSSTQKNKTLSLTAKPNIFSRIFARGRWKSWKVNHQLILELLLKLCQSREKLVSRLHDADRSLEALNDNISVLGENENRLKAKLQEAVEVIERCKNICGDKLVTPELWERNHEAQQTFTPNFTDEAQKLRDLVFVAAIKLHKAFIDASSKKLRQNLAAFFYCLGGGSLPEGKQKMLPDLWACGFLVTPVMSTAFASVGRMLRTMPAESIGWLLIDEAGQATPQAAIGAIYRARRVVSVGDPLQIEPVVTLPSLVVENIAKHMGVDPHKWTAPDASVQTVSDDANPYGTVIPRELSEIRIGTPLLVHRRCEDPMFTISNKLAYNGLMVHATVAQDSEITRLFGSQSSWFDVRGSAEEKWCPEEGDYVCNMLLRAWEHFSAEPEIFVITPFRIVAEKMRQRMSREKDRLTAYGCENPNSWIANNIGTVHTFQGREARAVIMLLGAPSPAQDGARRWVTSNVNLLNVAVSRAKQNFYVVGNKELWGELGNMKLVAQRLR